jgi:ribulose 1,5-bisphosphate carboxylase large subunit-like protein
VFVNSVHAHLAVLGPNIAFFVGGGIALSKKGIKAGAKNFAAAIDLAGRDLFQRETIRDLESKFVDLAAIYHENDERPPDYGLVLPEELKSVPNLHASTNLK